jgi:hypothetical protein
MSNEVKMSDKVYSVIHVFKNSVQLIGEKFNRLFPGHDWLSLQPLIDHVVSELGVEDASEFHVIHVFVGSRVLFLGGKKTETLEEGPELGLGSKLKRNNILTWDKVDESLVNALIAELEMVPLPEEPVEELV